MNRDNHLGKKVKCNVDFNKQLSRDYTKKGIPVQDTH